MKLNPKRLERHYEGPEVLISLLAGSGCDLTHEEVVEEFVCAVEEGTAAHEIIPLLWEAEPSFPDPAVARQTFSNLFGLWDLVASDAIGDLVQLGPPDPDAPLTPEWVEATWARLEDLEIPELRSARDTFENDQADATSMLFDLFGDADRRAAEVAHALAFETWWLLRAARGERAPFDRAAHSAALSAQEAGEPDPEPALAELVTAALWEYAAEDEAPLSEESIPAVAGALSALRRVWVR
jgi:hypothetical protein